MLLLFLLPAVIFSADITGRWQVINPKTGKLGTEIEIYSEKRVYFGRVKKHVDAEVPDARCVDCPPEFKDKPVQNLQILWGLKKGSREYYGGRILDVYNGQVYGVKVWLEDKNKLKVRGYFGPMLKSNTWQRVE